MQSEMMREVEILECLDSHRNVSIIQCEHLSHNLSIIHKRQPSKAIVLMLKGNAYGHGLGIVAQYLESLEDIEAMPCFFGVASLNEGVQLRELGIATPVLVFSDFFELSQAGILCKYVLIPVIHSVYQFKLLNEAAYWADEQAEIWMYLNTGMNQLGLSETEFFELSSFFNEKERTSMPINVLTHFAEAEVKDDYFNQLQMMRFEKCLRQAKVTENLVSSYGYISAFNSAASLRYVEDQGFTNMIRIGLALYGVNVLYDHSMPESESGRKSLKPVMGFYSRIIALREVLEGEAIGYNCRYFVKGGAQKIALISVGYGDGYPQHAPDGTPVYIKGNLCPIVGKVSMDVMAVNVTALKEVNINDVVELWGEHLLVEKLAALMGVSPYALVTGLSKRVYFTRRRVA